MKPFLERLCLYPRLCLGIQVAMWTTLVLFILTTSLRTLAAQEGPAVPVHQIGSSVDRAYRTYFRTLLQRAERDPNYLLSAYTRDLVLLYTYEATVFKQTGKALPNPVHMGLNPLQQRMYSVRYGALRPEEQSDPFFFEQLRQREQASYQSQLKAYSMWHLKELKREPFLPGQASTISQAVPNQSDVGPVFVAWLLASYLGFSLFLGIIWVVGVGRAGKERIEQLKHGELCLTMFAWPLRLIAVLITSHQNQYEPTVERQVAASAELINNVREYWHWLHHERPSLQKHRSFATSLLLTLIVSAALGSTKPCGVVRLNPSESHVSRHQELPVATLEFPPWSSEMILPAEIPEVVLISRQIIQRWRTTIAALCCGWGRLPDHVPIAFSF